MRGSARIARTAAFAAAVVAVTTAPASASAAPVVATLRVDQPVVTIDRDAPADALLSYDVVVENASDAALAGLVVDLDLPDGPVSREIGDLPPGAQWSATVAGAVPRGAAAPARYAPRATVRSADGVLAVSEAAVTDVQVISSTVVERTPEATPTEVLGVTYDEPGTVAAPAPAAPAGTLPATGAPLDRLTLLGLALVVLGGGVVRHSADAG